MPRTLISLGANLGNVRETMHSAQQMLRDTFRDASVQFSRLYRTPPIGGPEGQGEFLNGIVALESELDVWNVWEKIKRIETELGRHRLQRWEARRIDIDILLHDAVKVWTPHFKVPHPRMCMRSFLLHPALEVASNWQDPVSGWSIKELAAHLHSSLPICIATPTAELESGLKQALRTEGDLDNLEWISWPSPNDSETLRETPAFRLLIVAVATHDPQAIHWEDAARPWAEKLGMAPHSLTTWDSSESLQGPKYLLPSNDIDWACHEIRAAYQAMTCFVEPVLDSIPNND